MALPEIANLRGLLRLSEEKTIGDVEAKRLTATGENYGSQMLALRIHIKNNNRNEWVQAVAKLLPPGEFFRKMFNTEVTFRNEIDFYQTILPKLEAFLCERGIDSYLECFPEFLGGRLTLQEGKITVDDDAVLLLENLNVKGYTMAERTVGFDYEAAKLAVRNMAKLHAAPLGMKLLNPQAFQEQIRPLFNPYKVFDFHKDMEDSILVNLRKMIENMDSCRQYSDRVIKVIRSSMIEKTKNASRFIREPFATIIHTDLWVNNFMLQYQNDKPVSCKIIDFQLLEYGSPVRDFLFFVFTSVQIPLIERHYDDLLVLYHQSLIEDLVSFGCDPTPFSLEKFQEEIVLAAREFEVYHCILMLDPIYATKENIKELDEYKEEDMTMEQTVSPKQKERLEFLVREFVKRKWV